MHIKEVSDFLFIKMFILVLLHDLEMRVLVVRGPVGGLDLADPLVAARLVLDVLNALLGLLHPVVQVREVVRLKAAVHGLHTVPGHVPAGGQALTTVNLEDMTCDLGGLLRGKKDDSLGNIFDCCDALEGDVGGSTLLEVLVFLFAHAGVSVQVGVDSCWGNGVHTDSQGCKLQC